MTEIDIDAIRQKWQAECGPCDYGLPMGCMCPDGDPRVPISALIRKVDALTAELAAKDAVVEAAKALAESFPATLTATFGALGEALIAATPKAEAEEVCPACDKPGRHPGTCPTVPVELPEATR